MTQNINLYDVSLRKRRDVLTFESALAMVGAAAVCVALGAGAARWSLARIEPAAGRAAAGLQALQAAAQTMASRAASSKPDLALQSTIALAQRQLLQRRAALQTLAGNAPDREGGFSTRLEALARQSIDGLWLTGIVLQRDDLLLKGRTATPSLIPAYVQRLDNEPSLQGHAFRALDINRPLDGTAIATGANPSAGSGSTAIAPLTPGAATQQRAGFVEFTLVGTGSIDATVPAKEVHP